MATYKYNKVIELIMIIYCCFCESPCVNNFSYWRAIGAVFPSLNDVCSDAVPYHRLSGGDGGVGVARDEETDEERRLIMANVRVTTAFTPTHLYLQDAQEKPGAFWVECWDDPKGLALNANHETSSIWSHLFTRAGS